MSGHADTIHTAFSYPRRGNIIEGEKALDALLAENQRYEKALERIVSYPHMDSVPAARGMRVMAREALAGDTE